MWVLLSFFLAQRRAAAQSCCMIVPWKQLSQLFCHTPVGRHHAGLEQGWQVGGHKSMVHGSIGSTTQTKDQFVIMPDVAARRRPPADRRPPTWDNGRLLRS